MYENKDDPKKNIKTFPYAELYYFLAFLRKLLSIVKRINNGVKFGLQFNVRRVTSVSLVTMAYHADL